MLFWTRVNDLPNFVYFDHSIHVAKGVGCNTCHGPVDQMHAIGVQSLMLVLIVSMFTGAVAAVQAAYQFSNIVPLKYISVSL